VLFLPLQSVLLAAGHAPPAGAGTAPTLLEMRIPVLNGFAWLAAL